MVHMLTEVCLLPPPLTSTVKSSLFMHAHSSPFSLAAQLHQYHGNHCHYMNNGWSVSQQPLYNKEGCLTQMLEVKSPGISEI